MDTIKVKAIVLSSADYKEKDRLVTLFTIEHGIMQVVMKSVKTQKAKMKFAKEPFCFGEFIISLPSKIITSVEVEDNFFDVTRDIDKFYIACAILDTIRTIVVPGEKNIELFIETLKAIGAIAYNGVNDKYVLVKFLLAVFRSMGYSFALDKCSTCVQKFIGKRYLNLDFGEIVCTGCKSGNCMEISARCHSCFKILSETSYDKLNTIKLALKSEDEALNVLNINFERRFNKKLNLL